MEAFERAVSGALGRGVVRKQGLEWASARTTSSHECGFRWSRKADRSMYSCFELVEDRAFRPFVAMAAPGQLSDRIADGCQLADLPVELGDVCQRQPLHL